MPSLTVTLFFTMADNNPSPPLNQPKTISQMVLQPWFATVHLIQYLTFVPDAMDSEAALQELCRRDFPSIFSYLLSLRYTRWHRRFLMERLQPCLKQLPLEVLKRDLSALMPKLSALWKDPTTGEWFPIVGPLTDYQTVQWEVQDWFYQILHAKELEGQLCQRCSYFVHNVSILTYTHLRLHFS